MADLEQTTRGFQVVGSYDGTDTVVRVYSQNTPRPDKHAEYVGEGRARRRKGDPRNEAVGLTLALIRALEDWVEEERSLLPEGFEE